MNVEADGKIGLSIRKASLKLKDQSDQSVQHVHVVIIVPMIATNATSQKKILSKKMARFLKDSDERLATLKRATESKRGGRGARRG